MSFMFKPYPYEDMSAVNRPELSQKTINSVISGINEVCRFISRLPKKHFEENSKSTTYVITMEGYIGANWDRSLALIEKSLRDQQFNVSIIDVTRYYKSSDELEEMLKENLPVDRIKDPVSLFGKLYHGKIENLFEPKSLNNLIKKLKDLRTREVDTNNSRNVVIVYGWGAALPKLIELSDKVIYYDVTPMHTVLRALRGEIKNLGDNKERTKRYLFRRFYYVDFEVAVRLRERLLKDNSMDYYVDSNNPDELKLIPKEFLNEVFSSLVKYPFRCKPIYLEGVWGGFFTKNLRKLPKGMKNCAWVFDLIPNEVSLLVKVGKNLLEFPYTTFVRKEGVALMGKECVKRFKGVFPIRFNYDDTYQEPGNMSIQVHPTFDYIIRNFGEQFQQDETYYVVVTGGSKTYLGLKENADVEKFFQEVGCSEKERTPINYEAYINSIPSKQGYQFLIPAGTVHASGRNQVVLEIGSCTMGSYTFKLYDYVRLDLDGNPRPIHSWHGKKVLDVSRRTNYVKENLLQKPRLVRSGEDWDEYIIGEHEKMFFTLHRLEFEKQIEDETRGKFHVLALVEGEKVLVQSTENPEKCFKQNFYEIVVVPASFGRYVIKNLAKKPCKMTKTLLK